MYSGYLTWVFLGMVLVLSTLAVVLASLSRKLIGKGLIVASIVAFFLPDVLAAAKIVSMIVTHTYHAAQELDRWFSVMSLVYRSGVACLALFIFFELHRASDEARRDETLFSLFRPDSEIGLLDSDLYPAPLKRVDVDCAISGPRGAHKACGASGHRLLGALRLFLRPAFLDIPRLIHEALA